MKATAILKSNGIQPDAYPADACIGDDLIGTYSADRQTICLMIEDNGRELITREEVKEIAYTCKTLITNMGCMVHSWDMKNTKPYNNLTIIKTTNP